MDDPLSRAANFLASYGAGAMLLALVVVGFLFMGALDNPVKQSHLKFALLGILLGGLILVAAGYFVPLYLHAINPAFQPAKAPMPTATAQP